MNIVLPGNADLNVKGNVYSYEGDVFYQADVSLNSEDLMRLLKWMKIEPKATVASVYKKMLLTAKLSGNFDKFQISPYKVVLDNTTFNGDFGMVLGDRKDIMLNISADTLNFDNYINSIPEEIKAKSFGERLNYRFSKLGVFNDFDMVMNADSNLVIYENLPFENVKFKGNILQGTLDLEELTIEKAANTKIGLNGKISGFGNKANFENLQYDIETRDVNNMIEKFGLYRPKIDYNQFSDLKSSGVINGSADDFVIDTKITSGELSLDYNGDVKIAEKTFFNGDVEIKYPETVKFIENLGLGYKPESNNLGLFRLRSKAEGSIDNLKLTEMELNSGYSQFNGNLSYDLRGEKTIANANLKINKFEIEKYLVKENAKLTVPSGIEGGISSFLVKPVWDKNKLNYTPYVNLEVDANFETDNLSYKDKTFNNAKFSINLKDGMLNIPDFSAVYNNTPVKASVMLNMVNDPMINTTVEVVDANVSDFSFGGKTYGLKEGKFSTKISLNSNASSEDEFVKNLKGNAEFEAVNTRLSGINIKAIYDDVVNRTKSEGLVEFVNSQGATGNTDFAKISSKFSIDNGELKIVEGNLSADNTNISASGNCDLKNWTMDVMFDIGHNEPKFLPNYIMSAKSGMNNPEVTFDVSKLFNIFKAKEDQQIAEEKAQEAERKQILSQQINEQKKIIEDLVKSTKEKMTVEIDDKIINSFSDDSKKMYDDIKTEMNGLLETFLNKALAVDVENATSENIEELKIFNTKALQDIEILRNKIIKVNLTDLQKQNSSEYEKIVKINDELRQSVAGYNEIKATYTTRLANIITQYSLDKDENYKKLKNQVDETIDDLEKMNNDVVMARNLYSVNASVNEYEELNKKMGEVLDKLTDGKEKLDEHIKSLKETMDTVIKNEEDLYHKKMEEEENQRLIEENTGSISVKKTGKTLKVIRNIDDIKEANEDVSNDVVKVIDFTKENDTSKKDNVQKSNGIIKKGRINR